MTLPKMANPCDSVIREAAKMFTPSIYTKDSSHIRTKKNLERRRFRGIKRHRTDNSSTTGLLSPPHSPRSHVSGSSLSSLSLHRTPSMDLSTDSDAEDNPKKPRFELVPYTPEMSIASSCTTTTSSMESSDGRKQRYLKTASALRQSGLLDITMKTADLLRKNQELQRSIEALQQETRDFVTSVLSNKENRPLLTSITSRAQLYELVVPGSQNIMAVSAIPAALESPHSPTTTTGSLLPPATTILPPAELDSSSSSPDHSSSRPNTSSSDPQSDSCSLSDDNES